MENTVEEEKKEILLEAEPDSTFAVTPKLFGKWSYEDVECSEQALGAYDGDGRYDLKVGERVLHDHFGAGVVEELVGASANARATVLFEREGRRTLLLAYANLRVQR